MVIRFLFIYSLFFDAFLPVIFSNSLCNYIIQYLLLTLCSACFALLSALFTPIAFCSVLYLLPLHLLLLFSYLLYLIHQVLFSLLLFPLLISSCSRLSLTFSPLYQGCNTPVRYHTDRADFRATDASALKITVVDRQ